MNKEEYDLYRTDVETFFRTQGINCLSLSSEEDIDNCECSHCEEGVYIDPFFSWIPCECCMRRLGGDRYHVSGFNPTDNEVYCYSVCIDCLYFAEYGQLDDTTMMEVANA